jgi:adenylate cyclase
MNADEPQSTLKNELAEFANSGDEPAIAPEDSAILPHLQALVNASLQVTSALDLDKVLQRIADTARDFAGAAYAALGIVDEQGIITSFITSGISPEEREKIGEPPRGHGLLGVLIKQGKPLRVSDISKDTRRSGFPPNHPVMTSLLGVPVSLQGRIVGDLYLTDKIGKDEFSAQDEWWVTLFAQQAAVAVENAWLYKKAREAQQRSQTLAELTSALNRSIEPEELFQQITQASSRLLELPAALFVLDRSQAHFVLQAQSGLLPGAEGNGFLPLQGSIAGQVLEEGKTVAITDTSTLPQTFFLPLENGVLPQALLVVPIRQYEHINGVIEVYSAHPRAFSAEEISLLEAFAGQASLALEKAQLYKQKEEFLSMIAHDLRAPLTAIKMSVGLLESNLSRDLPVLLSRLVSNINRNSERLGNLLNDLLDLMRLEQGRMELTTEPVEIGELVGLAINNLLPLFEEKQQTLTFNKPEKDRWVQVDRHRFEQALVNLLTNANKYTPGGGKVEVTLQYEPDWVVITIKDSGPGIPPDEQNRIFDRYYRQAMHEQTNETAGTGLGLPIARYLVELHGGKLWVESEVGQGSRFFIKLPLAKSAGK